MKANLLGIICMYVFYSQIYEAMIRVQYSFFFFLLLFCIKVIIFNYVDSEKHVLRLSHFLLQ